MTYKNSQKLSEEKYANKPEFICKICEYITSRKSDYTKHLNTSKHYKNSNTDAYLHKTLKTLKLHCECGKSYKHRQSLYFHKKNCKYEAECDIKKDIAELKSMILNMSKSNANMLLNSHNTNNKIGSNNTNSFNTKNEIKIFLNEHCANALSIQEFIKQLNITMDDINNKKDNTVETITTILERNLKPLSITNRPIHHVDKDEWFLKDKEEWKEDDANGFIENTHIKFQNERLMKISNKDEEELSDDVFIREIKEATKNLSVVDRKHIKEIIRNSCKLNN